MSIFHRPERGVSEPVTSGFQPPRAQLWLSSPWPLLLAFCAAAALWILTLGNPLETLEMRWMGQILRWRFALGYAPPSDAHIVHLDVTRADLEKMPSLESEYRKAADRIRMATELGARVIAFDVIFARGTEAMNEPILREAQRARDQNRAVIFAEALIPKTGATEVERIRSFPNRERARPSGLINVKADSDGVFRQYEFARRAGENYEPSLSLAAYLAWREVPWESGVTFPKKDVLRWDEIGADFKTMTAHDLRVGPVLLNMRAPWAGAGASAFRHFTVAQLGELHGRRGEPSVPPLDNAVVFVSYTGTGLGDVGTTALAPNQPRVLLHSSALNDLIQNRSLHRLPRWADLLAVLAVALLGAAATTFRRTTPLVLFWLAALILLAGCGALLIVQFGLVAAIVLACTLWTTAIAAEVARRYSNELIERLKLRTTMGLYFSPRVMERVLQNPGSMEPQEAELTVLLTDLRNSTPIVEGLGARGTFAFLNQVFEAQTNAVMSEDGSLEHFLGDQFLSYWGAPDQQPDAADRAFRAALNLIDAMEKVRASLAPKVRELFGYGVALHSGAALFGNKGSAKRLDFGLVGDLINAAARIESLTKHYGVMFLLTRETYTKLSSPPPVRVVDEVIVKGKSVPLQLLEARHAFTRADFDAIAAEYNGAFERYRAGEFVEAGELFSKLGKEHDKPSVLMAARCAELASAPPADWHGVYQLQSK